MKIYLQLVRQNKILYVYIFHHRDIQFIDEGFHGPRKKSGELYLWWTFVDSTTSYFRLLCMVEQSFFSGISDNPTAYRKKCLAKDSEVGGSYLTGVKIMIFWF